MICCRDRCHIFHSAHHSHSTGPYLKKMEMEIALHHASHSHPPQPPPRLCVCLFLSDTSCCFFCTVCDAAWEGLWRHRNPPTSPWWYAVDSYGRSLFPIHNPPSLLLPPQPQLPLNLQQPLERGVRVTGAEVWETQPEKHSSPFYFTHN